MGEGGEGPVGCVEAEQTEAVLVDSAATNMNDINHRVE